MDVKPLQAVLVAAVFAVLVALAAYSGTQARIIQGPSDLRADGAGDLHVRIGDHIFVYDDLFRLSREYALDRFGIEGLLGNFDFFSDHSLLLVAEHIQPGPQAGPGRLLRCSFDSDQCRALPGADHRFKSSFRVAIDEQDNVFLADTARGAVYWLDEQGGHRDKLARELDRPNQVRRYGDQLAIANTEGEELLLVPLHDGEFSGEEGWQHIALDGAVNQSRRETRPLDFLRVGEDWFVLAKSGDMRSGAIYRYDSEGGYLSHITLPEGADPFALAYLGDTLVVADYARLKVYRYSVDGALLGNLESRAQTDYIDQLLRRQRNFSLLEYTAWGLFALALLIGFVVAIKGELSRARSKKAEAAEESEDQASAKPTARPHPMDARIRWLQPGKSMMWIGLLIVGLGLAMPLAIALRMPGEDDQVSACAGFTLGILTWGAAGMLLIILVPVLFKLRTLASTRIGVCDEWVLVDHGNGVVRVARDEDLLRVANGFIIEQVAVPTGTPQKSLYDKKELEKWLEPRLRRAGRLSSIKHLAWQWQHKRRLFIAGVVGILLLLAAVGAMEAGWAEEGFRAWLESRPECQKDAG